MIALAVPICKRRADDDSATRGPHEEAPSQIAIQPRWPDQTDRHDRVCKDALAYVWPEPGD